MDKDTQKYLISTLRAATVTWSGRSQCLNRGRRKRFIGKLKNGGDKYLWENNCEACQEWHLLKDNSFEVDHIVEVGPFTGNWDDFIKKLFCDQSNLQRLCIICHQKKTSGYNSSLRYQRKSSLQNPLDVL